MVIWFAALIPFIGAGALYWIFHHKVMNWNWEVVQGHLLVFGIPILVGILATWVLAKLVGRLKPKKAKQEDPRKTFLEEALEADAERPKPNKAYTWDDFQKDLHDGSLTFNEIYEKYGGVFPKKPEAPREGETKAQEKKEKGPGAKSDDPDRMAQLQMWFKDRGEERRLQGLVPPPPAPHTVIHKIYTRGRR